MKKLKNDNIVNFPTNLSNGEKEIEAILFAAAEPLDIDTIESKVPKKVNVSNILNKLQNVYKNRRNTKPRNVKVFAGRSIF